MRDCLEDDRSTILTNKKITAQRQHFEETRRQEDKMAEGKMTGGHDDRGESKKQKNMMTEGTNAMRKKLKDNKMKT